MVLAVLVLSLTVALWAAKDSDWLRETVAAAVGKAIGRSITLASWDIGLGSTITLELEGLSVAQPEGFDAKPFARVKSAIASVQVSELLKPPYRFNELRAEGVELHLQRLSDGRNNWKFGTDSPKARGSAAGGDRDAVLPLLLDQAELVGVAVSFAEGDQPPRRIEGDVTLETTAGGASLRIDGEVNGHAMGALLTARPLEALTSLKNIELLIDASLDDVTLVGAATFRDLLKPARPELKLRIDGPSIEYVTDRLQVAPIGKGPLNLDIAVQPSGELMAVRVDGLLGEFSAVLNGQFDNLRTLAEGDLAGAVSGPNLRMLGALLGADELPQVPFSINARGQVSGQQLVVQDARVNAGRLGISITGMIPNLENPTQANLAATANLPAIEVFRDLAKLPPGVTGPVDATLEVDTDGKQSDVSATLSSRFGELNVTGYLSNRPDLAGSLLDITAEGTEIADILALAGQEDKLTGPWSLASTVTVTPEQIELSRGQLGLDGAAGEFSLTTGRQRPGDSVRGQLAVAVENTRQTASSWLASPEDTRLLPEQPLEAAAALTWRDEALTLEKVNITLADFGITGDLKGLPAQNTVNAKLQLTGSNLANYLPSEMLPAQLTVSRVNEAFTIGGELSLTENGVAVDNLSLGFADLSLSGDLSLNQEQLHLDLESAVDDAFLWVEDEPDALAADGLPIAMRVDLDWNHGDIMINRLEMTSGTGSELRAQGALQLGESFAGSGLTVKMAIVDLSRLGILVGKPLPAVPLTFNADFEGDEKRLKATTFFLASGESEFSGALEITDPDHPDIRLALQAPLLDLRPFIPPPPEGSEADTEAVDEPPSATSPPDTSSRKNKRLVPDMPVDLSPLATFEADVDIQIDRLVGHTRRLRDLALEATVKEGRLLITEASATDETRGDISFAGFAVPGDGTNHIGLDVDGEDINLGFPARNPDEVKLLPRFNLVGEVYSSGTTLRELVGGLNGAVQVTAGEGRVSSQASGLLVNSFIDELLSLINPLRQKEDFTQVSCLVALADIQDGKLKGDPLATVVTDKLAIVGKAQIDLKTEKLFLTFNTIPQRGLGISASSAFKPFVGVAGTLARPQLTLDPEGTVIQGSLAVMTGGISLIGKSVIDRFTVSKKSCGKAENSFQDEREQSEARYFAFRDALLPTEESLTTP